MSSIPTASPTAAHASAPAPASPPTCFLASSVLTQQLLHGPRVSLGDTRYFKPRDGVIQNLTRKLPCANCLPRFRMPSERNTLGFVTRRLALRCCSACSYPRPNASQIRSFFSAFSPIILPPAHHPRSQWDGFVSTESPKWPKHAQNATRPPSLSLSQRQNPQCQMQMQFPGWSTGQSGSSSRGSCLRGKIAVFP